MDRDVLRGLLQQVREGAVDIDAALERMRHLHPSVWKQAILHIESDGATVGGARVRSADSSR